MVTVTFSVELGEPTRTEPKLTDVGVTVISGSSAVVPVPDRGTVTGFSSGSLEGMVRSAD